MTAPGSAVRRIGANSLVGSAWTLVSRVSGLLRAVVVAAVLGPTLFGDLFSQTANLPAMTFELLTGSLFVSLLVPGLVRHLDLGDSAAAARLAGGFLTVALAAVGVVVLLVVAGGPLVLDLLTANAPDSGRQVDPGDAWLLLALLMVQAPLYVVAGAGAAAQNARGRFALASAAPVVENLGIVLVLGAHAVVFGVGTAAGRSTAGVALLGAGTTLAVALHAAAQWHGARRVGVTLRPNRAWADAEVRALVRLAFPSMGHAALNVARGLGILVLAAAVPGGVVAFGLAYAFYTLPVALGAKPVSQAALPELSRALHRGDDASFAATFDRALGLVLFVTVPAAAAYALLAEPVATVVGFGEMATPAARSMVSLALLGISAGVVGAAALNIGTQAAYARRDARSPLAAVAMRFVLTAGGAAAAVAVLDGPRLLLGIGLAVAASDLLAGAWLCARVRTAGVRGSVRGSSAPAHRGGQGPSVRGTSLWGAAPALGLGRTGAATLALAAVVWPVGALLDPAVDRLSAVAGLLAAGAAGGTVYLLVQHRLRSPELAGLLALLGRRGGS